MNDGDQEVNDAVIILSTTCAFRSEHLWLRLRAPIGWTSLVSRLNGELSKDKILDQFAHAKLVPSSAAHAAAPREIDASSCSRRFGECFCPTQGYKWFEYYDLDGYKLGLGKEHDGMEFHLELDLPGVCKLYSIPFKYFHTECLASPSDSLSSVPPRRFSSIITTVCLSKEKSRAHDQFADLAFFRDLVKRDGYRNVYMWRSLPFGIRVRTAFFDTKDTAKKYISSFSKATVSPCTSGKCHHLRTSHCCEQAEQTAELSSSFKTALSYSSQQGAREVASKVAQFVSWDSGWDNSKGANPDAWRPVFPVMQKSISDLVKIIDASSVVSFKSDTSSNFTREKRKNDDYEWEKRSDVSPKKQRSTLNICLPSSKCDCRPALRPVDPSEMIISTSLNAEPVLNLNLSGDVQKSRSDISRASPSNFCASSEIFKHPEPMSPLSLDSNKDVDSLDMLINNFSLAPNDAELNSPCDSPLTPKRDSEICPPNLSLDPPPPPLGIDVFKTSSSLNDSPVNTPGNGPWEDYFKVNMNPFTKARTCECACRDILEPSMTPPMVIDLDASKANEVAIWAKTVAKYL